MSKSLHIEVVREPHPEAEREAARALDALADALADRLIGLARQEVAGERGLAEEVIDREYERVAETARAFSPVGVRTGHRAE